MGDNSSRRPFTFLQLNELIQLWLKPPSRAVTMRDINISSQDQYHTISIEQLELSTGKRRNLEKKIETNETNLMNSVHLQLRNMT